MKLHVREPFSYRSDANVPRFDDLAPIAFMDGECALCTAGARLICKLDRRGEFKICSTRSGLGQAVLRHDGLDPLDPDSWLYLENGKAYGSMEAIIRVGMRLRGLGQIVRVLSMLPRSLQDRLYRRLARNRYQLFGLADLCAMPDPALRRRLIG